MHHDFIDRYSRGNGPIHRLPAAVKMASGLIYILVVVLAPLKTPFLFPVLALFVAILSRIPALFMLKRLVVFEPFVLVIAALSLLQPGGKAKFVSIIIRSTLCLAAMLLVSNTTPFAEALRILRQCHVPPVVVTLLALMYRYIFVLIDETQRMRRAKSSRTFAKGRARSWKLAASIIGQLFLRSTERAERIFAAMSARGWR